MQVRLWQFCHCTRVQLVLSLQVQTCTLLRAFKLHKALLVVCSCHAVQGCGGVVAAACEPHTPEGHCSRITLHCCSTGTLLIASQVYSCNAFRGMRKGLA